MGEYEDLVELGFEGVDRLATRFHHPAPGAVHHSPEWESDRRRGTGGHKHNVSSPSQSPQRKGRARTISPEDRGRQRDINRGARSPKQYSGHPLPPPREQLNGGRYPPPPPSQYPRYVPLAQPKPEEFLPVKQPLPIGARSQQQQYPPNLPPGTASVLHGKDWEDHDNDSMYESYGYTPDGRRVLLRGGEWSRNDWREDDWRASRRRSPKKKGLSRSVFVVRRDVSRHGRMVRSAAFLRFSKY
ncbi:hypothetical protein CC80DRAFT_109472 [Byssothecium circinans]|uniref:Uncharacterized protein n=1 Tax=Byssothecium circinans TaxID=147558 RepID=A0A6A5TW83_9PLEO|nr:hypothetical protein CC80DRAFT_109472 [Byssothecium circinans]